MKVTLYSSFATAGLAHQAMSALKSQGARADEVSAFFPSENNHQLSQSPKVGAVLGEGVLAQAWKERIDDQVGSVSGVAGFLKGQGIDHRFARDAEQAIGHSNAILLVDCRPSPWATAVAQPTPAPTENTPFSMLQDQVSILLKQHRAGLVVQLQQEHHSPENGD